MISRRLAAAWALTFALAALVARDVGRRLSAPELRPPDALPEGLVAPPVPRGESGYHTPADCRGCHEQAWKAWKRSRHADAAVGKLFQIGFRVEPMRWCLGCHSPEERDPAVALVSGEGVTCAACHNRAGGIATSTPPERWGAAPHRLVHDPGLANGQACARCHQSDIPLGKTINQDTMGEWTRAGGEKAGRCIDCHMPRTPGDGHAFVATRDPDFLARSIPGTARFVGGADGPVLEITLGPARAAHAVPTGDPFRELAVVWSVTGGAGEPLAAGEELLGRRSRVVAQPDGTRRMLELDERLEPGKARTWRRKVPAGRGKYRAQVRLVLRLMAGEMTRVKGFPGYPVETPFATLQAADPAD